MQIEKVQRNSDLDLKYSIIIPTWNNLEYLKLVIRSIKQNSSFKHQIIVHVNEGKDGSYEWIKQQTDIDYTYSATNIGICYAMNICRSLMKTDYLVYVNDDMYVCPNWDSIFDEEIKKIGSKDFFLSCTLIETIYYGNDCTIVKDYGRDLASFREEDLLNEFESLPKEDWAGSTWPICIVHIDNWDLVGGYSIEFSPGMYSDPDFSRKLWNLGIRYFKGISASRAYHFGSKSTKRVKINNGHRDFILKWGITSSTFTKKYLKRGQKFTGPLPEIVPSTSVKIKNKLKYILASIKK